MSIPYSAFQPKKKRLSDSPDQLFAQMDINNINMILAAELLEAVFFNLSPEDLKSALLVCRRWRRVGEYSKLWSWVTLKITPDNLPVMTQALATDRLKSMKELHVEEMCQVLLQAIDNHTGLERLNINFYGFCPIEPSLLAKIINKMEFVGLEHTRLTPQQCQAIFNPADNESKLKYMIMPDSDLSSVDPQILARFVTKLEEVNLLSSHLTPQQGKAIFEFASRETKLVKLNMEENDLSAVSPEKISSVVSKLGEVSLNDTNLTSQQCKQIFKLAVTAEKLETMSINECDLSSVDPNHLAIVVSKLLRADISDNELTPEQGTKIFEAIANDSSKVEELVISFNDLSAVNEEILARGVSKLKTVDLTVCNLTTQQCNNIFSHLSLTCRLEEIRISFNHLSGVNTERMAQAISKLRVVDLSATAMSSEQYKILFENLSSDCQLKNFKMGFNHLGHLDEVDPEDLARIVPNLERANLSSTGLTSLQSEAIFKSIDSESKIKKLVMGRNDFSLVNPELLARAITNLEEVDLSFPTEIEEEDSDEEEEEEDDDDDLVYTGLNAKQCQVIFQFLAQDSKNLKKLNLEGNEMEFVESDLISKVSAKLELIM